MAQFSISYNGRQYHYGEFRYDQLADAIAYARRNPGEARAAAAAFAPAPAAPDDAERQLMDSLGITYRDGIYHLRDFRYDRLADAVNYARLRRMQGMT